MNDHDSKLSGSESDFVQIQIQKDQISITSDTDSDSSEFQSVKLEPISETTTPVKEDKSSPIRQTLPKSSLITERQRIGFDMSRFRINYESRRRYWYYERRRLRNAYWTVRNIVRRYEAWDQIVFIFLLLLVINSYWLICQNQETRAMISSLQSQIISNQKQSTEKSALLQPSTPLQKFNAASFAFGATVDTSKSSSTSLNPFFGYDQSSMVLIDRLEPPANRAWCTYEKEPVLTVNLAERVKPTDVSYQHSKWNGTIPDDAPKVYDVMACLDYNCEVWESLASNCTYASNGQSEQFCNISSSFSTKKVQFRFQGNQGNSSRTCVSLVRVYSEAKIKPKVRSVEDAETCSDLKYDYHNRSLLYNYFDNKSCSVLYSKECCQECPECCEECDAKDFLKLK